MIIEVTQFYRPHGETKTHTVQVADDCAVGYESLKRHGCRLTAEVLMSGVISQTVEHELGDYDIELSSNSQDVITALEKMIRNFDGAKFEKWLEGQNA